MRFIVRLITSQDVTTPKRWICRGNQRDGLITSQDVTTPKLLDALAGCCKGLITSQDVTTPKRRLVVQSPSRQFNYQSGRHYTKTTGVNIARVP